MSVNVEKLNSDTTVATFICMKWGTKYPSPYVNQLYKSIQKNFSKKFRFICLTEDKKGIDKGVEIFPLPLENLDTDKMDNKKGGETWRKVSLFKKGIANIKGDAIFLDLDIVIKGNLDFLFSYKPGEFIVIQDWLEKKRAKFNPFRHGEVGNTSLFRFNPEKQFYVYDYFISNVDKIFEKFRIEQQYVSWIIRKKEGLSFWDDKKVLSYKRSCRSFFPFNWLCYPKEPTGNIIVFHGHPLPGEAIKGYNGGFFKTILKAEWLKKYWSID